MVNCVIVTVRATTRGEEALVGTAETVVTALVI